MNTSPVNGSWEGVDVYYTFAHHTGLLSLILIASVIVTIGAIVISAKHESDSAKKHVVD